jgi:Fic family protein
MDVIWMLTMKNIKVHILTSQQLALITQIERFQGAFEATKYQKPALIKELKQTTIITSSGSSTRIEGAILTDIQVKELVERGCKITKISSRSEREVAGYIKALLYVYDNYEDLSVSEKTIRELHSLLTSELLKDQLPKKQRGTYKDVANSIIEKNLVTGESKIWFETTPAGPATNTAMEQLISSYNELSQNKECHSLIIVASFIVQFLAVHPFRDGNGRLSRLLTSFLLLKQGYKWSQFSSHEKVIEDNKEGYYISLRDTQATLKEAQPDYSQWITFFLKIVSTQAEILQSMINRESPLSELNENESKIYQIIKANQRCKISFLLEQVDMSRAGLKSLLKKLVVMGIINKEGEKKGTVYHI